MPNRVNSLVVSKGSMSPEGLYDLAMDAYAAHSTGYKYLGRLIINSGAPGHQNLRAWPGQPQKLEPCPEGEYDLGPLEWAGGVGNYDVKYPSIESPIWQVVVPSRAIGIHLDGNRNYSPGTAGCWGIKNMADVKTFCNWVRGYGDFKKGYVNYGLNHVKVPAELRPTK